MVIRLHCTAHSCKQIQLRLIESGTDSLAGRPNTNGHKLEYTVLGIHDSLHLKASTKTLTHSHTYEDSQNNNKEAHSNKTEAPQMPSELDHSQKATLSHSLNQHSWLNKQYNISP